MKRCVLMIGLIPQFVFGQLFTALPVITILDLTTVSSSISVTGIGEVDCDFGLTEVCVDITHFRAADVEIYLQDPLGRVFELSSDNGGAEDHYTSTCFKMDAATNIVDGSAPFTGDYIPETDIDLINNYQDADGIWTLYIYDDRAGFLGILNEWSLHFGASPPCPAATLEDCGGGETICSDVTLEGNSSGSGNFRDLNAGNDGCLDGENESSWYYFQAASDGDYAFTIETLVDYDFAIWGPLTEITCPPPVAPLRCSYAGATGNTGLTFGAVDETEDEFGDGWVNAITATELDIYLIVIDNYTADGSTYDLSWTLMGGGSFDCALLPLELLSFEAEEENGVVALEWLTASELNTDYYEVEWSGDAKSWQYLTTVSAAGESSSERSYQTVDYNPAPGLNYYRLNQTDKDGNKLPVKTISVHLNEGNDENRIIKIINLMGDEVDESYNGIKVEIYQDGSQRKVMSQ
ncbi:proprotein convertase P-domain-containing protein [Crocinitomix algicola]|uniref:proprotein convertase P-domain-containing protein n=1 Tax=Crocinitomix algicola TaxID=1740263 RepID=UPI0008361B31|nr:proprotein convertase P-domain-containing protein [Crocinitomix algicola]